MKENNNHHHHLNLYNTRTNSNKFITFVNKVKENWILKNLKFTNLNKGKNPQKAPLHEDDSITKRLMQFYMAFLQKRGPSGEKA